MDFDEDLFGISFNLPDSAVPNIADAEEVQQIVVEFVADYFLNEFASDYNMENIDIEEASAEFEDYGIDYYFDDLETDDLTVMYFWTTIGYLPGNGPEFGRWMSFLSSQINGPDAPLLLLLQAQLPADNEYSNVESLTYVPTD